MIEGATLLVIGFIVALSVFTYSIYTKTNSDYLEITGKIAEAEVELNNLKVDLGTINSSIKSEVDSINLDVSNLKDSSDFSILTEKAIRSVVVIKGDVEEENKIKKDVVLGSGFFVTSDLILTNCHVIFGIDTTLIHIKTYDGKEYGVARDISDSQIDTCLLKVKDLNITYPSLKLGNSDDVQVGEKVMAIGNPTGLEFSVTSGIVSATSKKIKNSYGREMLGSYIQTDVSLNPGNSGGPLINTEGKVIGVNSYKIFLAEGLGFALESNTLQNRINKIAIDEIGYRLI